MKKNKLLLLVAAILLSMVSFPGLASRVDTLKLSSPRLPAEMEVLVLRPDGLSRQGHPVVYLLNGYDGDCHQWLKTQPRLRRLADEYGMIMVFPSGMDSWYLDVPGRPDMQFESFITEELVPYIDAHYPTNGKRAITGLSMGGHGALALAMDHPELFVAAGSTSGGVDIRPFSKRWGLDKLLGDLNTNAELWQAASVAGRAERLTPESAVPAMIFDCGKDDFFADVNERLHRRLLSAGVPHDYISRPGRHAHSYWANSVLYHLLFFHEKFNQ